MKKSIVCVLSLLACLSVSTAKASDVFKPGHQYTCNPGDSVMFGKFTLDILGNVPVASDIDEPIKNARTNIYLSLDKKIKAFDTTCFTNPANANNLGCIALDGEGSKVFPFLFISLESKIGKAVITQDPGGDGEVYTYRCTQTK
ncbi:hypothetical protein COU14_00795 [Candidatus Kaiserbacteria bacterium CG10_big_fil_rev_8_21_14_0_10_44_10]|uniref:Ig-like domain-containing protein n=1 Tax=Candidatus Kaiserbacteria bacterium CG10_big_fil_rev_8_21_14_0_10_44_10 TaxID=1974606 RepID=A0A2H0UI54_9BACT|nr:MAG: hypothetical protein COU14_00795 [Candidatus Kaiserbacteria bacterium CG10_big_fil_rev_8_21_14_0_10_44_10]